jgi:2-oxoglutarate ferredoxin oxidoreductase subunit gamma
MGARIEFSPQRLCGQGVISAGIILASAAVQDGKFAIQSQSNGPEARGGASKAEVVVSNEPIDYPKATTPDYVLCLTNEAFRLYGKTADKKTVIFADEFVDTSDSDKKVIKVPIIKAALEIIPGPNSSRWVLLVGYTKIVTRESAIAALKDLFPKFIEKNMLCVEADFVSRMSCSNPA